MQKKEYVKLTAKIIKNFYHKVTKDEASPSYILI